MVDELLQLCPVQFIEGINEDEEPIEPSEGRFWQPKDLKVAIPYEPIRTYTLSLIEIFGSPWELDASKEHQVGLYTDKNNLPSEICISKGKLVVPTHALSHWLQMNLEPIVVFRGQHYWIVLEDYSLKFAIGVAKNGKEVAKTGTRMGQPSWVSIDTKIRYMLKFFGRALPMSM